MNHPIYIYIHKYPYIHEYTLITIFMTTAATIPPGFFTPPRLLSQWSALQAAHRHPPGVQTIGKPYENHGKMVVFHRILWDLPSGSLW